MDGQPSFPVRASDTQRDRVLRVLSDRVAEGRMSNDTFERRVDQVLRARSQAELADIVHDLPPPSRVVDRLTGLISSVSHATARIEAAWRAPRLPRFMLPPAELRRIVIGRAPACQFVLTDLTVSRFHAEIYPAGEGWTICDLGSMNGTRVNGWRLTGPARLRPGDEVGFGNAVFIATAP
ncbi:FHA domain-containing protein [Actinomadura formosensis]|uniref:FHA domain-containing protein n=1 Tax=Actinomadura formosensis TaxID=60706 RepID=UPI003D8F2B9F